MQQAADFLASDYPSRDRQPQSVRCEVVSGVGCLPRLTLSAASRLPTGRCEGRASSTSSSGIRTVDVLLVYGEH